MATEIAGDLVVNEISTDNFTWKLIMCEDTSTLTNSASTTDTKTKCGAFSATSVDPAKVSGSGITVGNVTSEQVSFQQLMILLQAKTKIWLRRQNAADVSNGITVGELVYFKAQGYISSVAETSNTGEVSKFTWEFSSTGTVDTDPAS